MTISNSALAAKLDLVASGWQNFVVQQINYLTSTEATVTLTDPYDATISVVVKTPVELARMVDALVTPATGALAEAAEHLAAVELLVANAESAFDGIDAKILIATNLVSDAQGFADTASTNAGAASTSANQAANSASSAATSATNAATSATQASASATAAADSANVAMTQRARTWYVGDGLPGTFTGQLAGDFYMDRLTGDVYELIGSTWTFKQNLKGPKGDRGDVGPQGPAGADGNSIAASEILTRLKTVDGSTSGLDADLLDGQDGAYYLAWANFTGKPTTFTPTAHTHAWGDITSPPVQTTRWPAWSEVTSKPTTFAPSAHTHVWADVTGAPETATRWPAWGEVTGKPGTFTPAAHSHVWADISNPPVYTSRWPSWTEVTGKPTSMPPDAHVHEDLYVPDSRTGAVRLPSSYPRRTVGMHFLAAVEQGSPGGDTYNMTMNVTPWTAWNAGYRVQQLAFTGAGGLKFRYSTSDTAWDVWQTIWTDKTFDPATKLDVTEAVTAATANKVVLRDGSGDVQARLFRPNYANQTTISGAIAYRINNSTDNYIRFCSDPAAVREWAGLGSAATLEASAAAVANTVVQRNSSGYIVTNYFNTTAAFTTAEPTAVMVETGSDGFIRKQTMASFRNNLGIFVQSGDPGAAAADGDLWIY